MKICYISKKFTSKSRDTIEIANNLIDEYSSQGYNLTLRQLYYQFVARGHIDNNMQEYKKLGSVVNDARLAGEMDWNAIEDRTRNLQKNSHWFAPEDILETASEQFAFNKREGQEYYIEVWVEKDALVGVLERVCTRNDVPFFSCRGYTSQSEMWSAGMRFLRKCGCGSEVPQPVILHLGDHDPSGIDMSRDIEDRMNMFYAHNCKDQDPGGYFNSIRVERLALNMVQVAQYRPPPNPAKSTDSRFLDYRRKYGSESWELDALEPSVIESLIEDAIDRLTDWSLFDKMVENEKEHKHNLKLLSERYDDAIRCIK